MLSAVWNGESLLFLYTDGDYRYCRCEVGSSKAQRAEGEQWPVIPEYLKGTSVRWQPK